MEIYKRDFSKKWKDKQELAKMDLYIKTLKNWKKSEVVLCQ